MLIYPLQVYIFKGVTGLSGSLNFSLNIKNKVKIHLLRCRNWSENSIGMMITKDIKIQPCLVMCSFSSHVFRGD